MVDMGSKVQKMNETRSLRREAASAREEVTLTTSATFSRKCHHTQRPNHEHFNDYRFSPNPYYVLIEHITTSSQVPFHRLSAAVQSPFRVVLMVQPSKTNPESLEGLSLPSRVQPSNFT